MNGHALGRGKARRGPTAGDGGFSLPELLVALALGLTLATAVIQGLQRATEGGARWMLHLRERQTTRRTLELIRDELGVAQSWEDGAVSGGRAECPLGGRAAVLGLEAGGRRITYSIGSAPSRIWRGGVLMRCGPAYALSGGLSDGQALNRVVIDGVEPDGLQVTTEGPNVLRLRLKRRIQLRTGMGLNLTTKILVAEPEG